jgi:iron complex outermembrane receptor protein
MTIAPNSLRRRLLLAGVCGLALGGVGTNVARADGSAAQVNLGLGQSTTEQTESIVVRAKRQLLKDKNSPSAVTELGAAQITQTGVGGSIATLLRQAPSVFVYQQGIGNNEPVLTIRGVRGLETAQTLDGVPMQDLLFGGTGGYLQNIIGGRFNLDQISGVAIYPGVAYPDKNTFGTIGGTVAYSSKRPDADPSVEVFGSVGSFKLFNEGVTLNTGAVDSPFGTGDNAARAMLQYSNMQNAGFVDWTPSRYNNFMAAFDKPYDDGLSKFQATVLYNTGNALYTPEPVPLPYLAQNGRFSNYSPDEEFTRQTNNYLSLILKDDTYINDYLTLGLTAFYLNSNSTQEAYGNPLAFGDPALGTLGSYTVDGAAPFLQTTAGFGYGNNEGLYGPGGLFYDPFAYRYNPLAAAPPGSAACPTTVVNRFGGPTGAGLPCGLNAIINTQHNDSYGIQPRALITVPEIFGIEQNIHVGALIAKETQPATPSYEAGTANIPETPNNTGGIFNAGGYDGGAQRTIYQGYIQDKIDLLDNSFHITPGVTIEGTYSSNQGSQIFGGKVPASELATPYCQTYGCAYGYFKGYKWDRDYLPFLNVAYDFDKIYPPLKGLTVYASTGQSALFAPVSDFQPNLAGPIPGATIVHLYEGGVKYNVSDISVSADYFYQKIDRDFGFFQYQSGPLVGQSAYNNLGQREFKGVEAAVTWQVTPQIQLFGNMSHQLAKYLVTNVASVTVQEDQFGDAIKGRPVSGVPDWQSNFGVDYTPKSVVRDNDQFEARLSGLFSGHQYSTYDLTGTENIGPLPIGASYGQPGYYSAVAGATVTDPNPKDGISPYVIWNLDLNYKLPTPELPVLKSVKFDLNLQNLFNHMYFQYFYHQISPSACTGTVPSGIYKGTPISNYGCTPEFADGIPGEPFAVIFTVSAKF